MREDRADIVDLPGLMRLAWKGRPVIVACAALFLLGALGWAVVQGPKFEATTFLEVDDPEEVATVAQKLRFPSLSLEAAQGDESKARDLARRTRVKVVRDTRIISLTVRAGSPDQCARSANAIAAAFLSSDDSKTAGKSGAEEAAESFDLSADGDPVLRPVATAAAASGRPDVKVVEKASPSLEASGPSLWLVGAGAAAAGAFCGLIIVLLREG